MSDVELRDELMTMLLAGHETTATGLAFAFDLLMREPRVLARLRDELDGEDDTYLDAVVTESLRLRPVIDANERTLTKPRTIGGWDLPAGIRVYPAIVVVQLREDLYSAPARVPPRALHRGRGDLLLLAALRRRHPPLHRRRPGPGRDGRGDPHGRLARRPRTRTARPRTRGHARHHPGPSPRHAGSSPKPSGRRWCPPSYAVRQFVRSSQAAPANDSVSGRGYPFRPPWDLNRRRRVFPSALERMFGRWRGGSTGASKEISVRFPQLSG